MALSAEQKRLIEVAASEQIRRSWGGLNATRVRGAIDDIRAKLIEEPWYGRPVTRELNDPTYTSHRADTASAAELAGHMADTARSAWEAVWGPIESDFELAAEPKRDGPELGD
jgi:hypothetical protein